MGQEPEQIREQIEETRGQMGETVDALAYKADVPSRVKDSFSDRTERLKNQMRGTSARVNEATPSTGDVKDGAQQAVGVAQENPIGLALGGVAAGFLVGMMLPSTKLEDERMGEASDEMIDTVKDAGQEALEHGKQVASDVAGSVAETATETAKESGQQHAEELKGSVSPSEGNGSDGNQPTGTVPTSGTSAGTGSGTSA